MSLRVLSWSAVLCAEVGWCAAIPRGRRSQPRLAEHEKVDVIAIPICVMERHHIPRRARRIVHGLTDTRCRYRHT